MVNLVANSLTQQFRRVRGGAHPSYKLVINPLTIDIAPTKTIVFGVMFTNLAIERGHHIAGVGIRGILSKIMQVADC